jgi:hypothetical protein
LGRAEHLTRAKCVETTMTNENHAATTVASTDVPTKPRFDPWVGERYHGGGRVLLVGESHHGPAHQNDDKDFTASGIRKVIHGRESWNKLLYFKNLQRVFARTRAWPKRTKRASGMA